MCASVCVCVCLCVRAHMCLIACAHARMCTDGCVLLHMSAVVRRLQVQPQLPTQSPNRRVNTATVHTDVPPHAGRPPDLVDAVIEGAHCLLNGRVGVRAVREQHINVVHSHALQGRLRGQARAGWGVGAEGVWIHHSRQPRC
jgi:hypothetical protein